MGSSSVDLPTKQDGSKHRLGPVAAKLQTQHVLIGVSYRIHTPSVPHSSVAMAACDTFENRHRMACACTDRFMPALPRQNPNFGRIRLRVRWRVFFFDPVRTKREEGRGTMLLHLRL